MKIHNSCFIAFGMYSKIPVPQIEWKEEDMKYAICFFPVIGAVIGGIVMLAAYLSTKCQFGTTFRAALLTVLPLYLSGGIHMDGYCDTMDALSSYQSKEKKLEILKDPHTGAFAIIRCCMFLILYFGCVSELSMTSIAILSCGFVLSRTFSGLSVVWFQTAKKKGTLSTFHEASHKRVVTMTMCAYLIVVTGMMFFLSPIQAIVALTAAVISFVLYRKVSYREFGGTTGDLAGFFLQRCELLICLGLAVTEGVMRLWS